MNMEITEEKWNEASGEVIDAGCQQESNVESDTESEMKKNKIKHETKGRLWKKK